MQLDLNQPMLPTLAELAQTLEDNPQVFDLFPVGEPEEWHNFTEPSRCRCFPEIMVYSSLEGKPDLVTVTHKWTM